MPLSEGTGCVVEIFGVGSRLHSEVEREHILQFYRQSGGNKTQTADLLGINRLTPRRKLKEFGIE